jgi:hypothetical protein
VESLSLIYSTVKRNESKEKKTQREKEKREVEMEGEKEGRERKTVRSYFFI